MNKKKYRVWYKDVQMGYIDVDAEDASKAREMADDILYDERGRLDGYSHDMDGYEYVTTNSLTGISIQDDFTDVP